MSLLGGKKVKKNIIIILVIILTILIGLVIQIKYFSNTNKNLISTNYICKKEDIAGDKTITTYRNITTDEFLAIQNVDYIIEYKYINNTFYEDAKEKIIENENYKYLYDDKNMIISMTEKNDIENIKNQYYYSYISYLESGFECTPQPKKGNYKFICSNDNSNFELITDNKLVVTKIKNESEEQLLLDNLNNIQKIWINKYIEVLNDGYSCRLKD